MTPDKYKAVWVSHSSLGDFMKCPRAYYLHNVYKDPETGRKINITNPHLALGVSVHEVIEGLIAYPAETRSEQDLLAHFDLSWQKVSGLNGGFFDEETEAIYKKRGLKMIEQVMADLGPLKNKAVRLKESQNGMPPNYFLSEEDNIILCGKIDWLEYLSETNSLHIIDFKTGQHEEKDDSLQLPIYLLLLNNLQKRLVSKASYWYLDRPEGLIEKKIPDLTEAKTKVLTEAKKVKLARETNNFICPQGPNGCFFCLPFEKILAGEAVYVGVGGYGQDIYAFKKD